MLSIITTKAWRFQVRLRENKINLALGYKKVCFFSKSEFFSIRLLYIKLTIFAAENELLKVKKWLKSAGRTFHRVSLTYETTCEG